MLRRFKTILQSAQSEIIEKKSRFIATVRPVKDEKEAQAFIEEMRKKYWDATHNVFAYQIGERNQIQRFSDDGEPGGTAGMPVLDVLKGEDLKNTAIVVTRYFGGTLLGTGGLVRAYGRCAKDGVIQAKIIEKKLYSVFHVVTDYSRLGKIQYEILQMGHIIHDTIYTDTITFIILVEEGLEDKFINKINEVSSAQADIKKIRYVYATLIEDKVHIEEINEEE